jgi:hypothetical protein
MEAVALNPQLIAILVPLARLFLQQCLAWATKTLNDPEYNSPSQRVQQEFKSNKEAFRKAALGLVSSASGAWLGALTLTGPIGLLGGGIIGGALGIHYAITNRPLDQTIKKLLNSTEQERISILNSASVSHLPSPQRVRELEVQVNEESKKPDSKNISRYFGVLNDIFASSYQTWLQTRLSSLPELDKNDRLLNQKALNLVTCTAAASVAYDDDVAGLASDKRRTSFSVGINRDTLQGFVCTEAFGVDHFKVFFIESGSTVIVLFRGTQTHHEMLVNCNFMPSSALDQEGGLHVHGGYKTVVDSLVPQVQQFVYDKAIVGGKHCLFTGHSLGGALATLTFAAVFLANRNDASFSQLLHRNVVECITFGAPQVLKLQKPSQITRYFTQNIEPFLTHVVHQYDLVPRIFCQLDKVLSLFGRGMAHDLRMDTMNFCPVGRLVILWSEAGSAGKTHLSLVPTNKKQDVLQLPEASYLPYSVGDHFMDIYEKKINAHTSNGTSSHSSTYYSFIESMV